MKTIGSSSYLFAIGTHSSTGNGYVYTNLVGCSCFLPDYVDSTGRPYDYWQTLGTEYTPTILTTT